MEENRLAGIGRRAGHLDEGEGLSGGMRGIGPDVGRLAIRGTVLAVAGGQSEVFPSLHVRTMS